MKSKNMDRECQFNFEAAAAQRDKLLAHLKVKDISTVEARNMGIMSPAARILELRRKGYRITTDKCEICTTDGAVTFVALYRLITDSPESQNGEKG